MARLVWACCAALLAAAVLVAAGTQRASATTTATTADPNLLINGSFEQAGTSPGPTTGWQDGGGRSAAWKGGAQSGSYFADFVPTASGGSIYQDVPVTANGGQLFQASIWIKSSTTVTLALWGNFGGTGSALTRHGPAADWTKLRVSMRVRAKTSSVRLQVFAAQVNSHNPLDNATLTYQLLRNSSFESPSTNPGPTRGWQLGSGRAAAWKGAAQNGSYFADFVPTTSGGNIFQDAAVRAGTGQVFQAGIWLKSGSGTRAVTVALWGNFGNTGSAATRVSVHGSWIHAVVSMRLRGATSSVRLQIFVATRGSHIHLDNASLTYQALHNGSFETAGQPAGWRLGGGLSATYTGDARSGSRFADFVPTVSGGSIYQDVPLVAGAGQVVQASIWVRSASKLTVALWGNYGGTGGAVARTGPASAWKQVSVSMTLRGATSSVRLQVVSYAPHSHNHLDAATLRYQVLHNNSFESAAGAAAKDWRFIRGHATEYSGAAEDGSQFVDFVPTAGGGSIYQDVAVRSGVGQIFEASIWVRSTTGRQTATLAVWGNVNATGAALTRVTATASWTLARVSMPVRGDTSTVRMQVYGGAAGSHLQLDDGLLTPVGPPPQTAPPPIATSRYLRDLTGGAGDVPLMRSRGAADAAGNPSNHAYLTLLDIGGQDQPDGGSVLSATSRFVTYGQVVTAVDAYVDGYASAQRSGAPAVIAISTNNDMDVSAATGRDWANRVIDPIAAHARAYPGITIAGADDIEPGFSAGVGSSRAWLSGYLAATTAKFVFNGSADGCSWTGANGGCNNGWHASDLYWLAAGARPTQIIALPQIYNTTMAQQWKFISLTGVESGQPRVDFGGALTELTACQQAGSCFSLSGASAWSSLWSSIGSDVRTRQQSLPYSTDLRIN